MLVYTYLYANRSSTTKPNYGQRYSNNATIPGPGLAVFALDVWAFPGRSASKLAAAQRLSAACHLFLYVSHDSDFNLQRCSKYIKYTQSLQTFLADLSLSSLDRWLSTYQCDASVKQIPTVGGTHGRNVPWARQTLPSNTQWNMIRACLCSRRIKPSSNKPRRVNQWLLFDWLSRCQPEVPEVFRSDMFSFCSCVGVSCSLNHRFCC